MEEENGMFNFGFILIKRIFFVPVGVFTDPYVKVYMIGSGKRLKKKKTTARKNTNNPVWNEAVAFSISPAALATGAVEVQAQLQKEMM